MMKEVSDLRRINEGWRNLYETRNKLNKEIVSGESAHSAASADWVAHISQSADWVSNVRDAKRSTNISLFTRW